MEKEQNKKLTVSGIFAWILGLLFLLSGFGMLFNNFLSGILLILTSVFILPPAYNFLRKRIKVDMSKGLRILIAVILLIIAGSVMGKGTKEEINNTTENVVDNKMTQEETGTENNQKSYNEIFSFSGKDIKKSEPFVVSGSRFKVKINCQGSLCQAWLKRPGSSLPTELLMNSTDPIFDETIVYGSGEYYIDVNSMGSWSFTIEDYN